MHTQTPSSWWARLGVVPDLMRIGGFVQLKRLTRIHPGSALIRKTSNLDFATAVSSYPRAIQVPAYRYPSRYRYRAPPSELSSRGAAAKQTRIYGACFER